MSDHEDYAHVHDAQSQRTRREMWLILAIVVVVIVGGLIWRAVAHVPAKPQRNWTPAHNVVTTTSDVAPAAAAGVHPTAPAARPLAP